MPRDLVLSNGHLMVTFDASYTLSDIYYPHVGMENHAYRLHSRLGVWAAGEFAWLSDAGWERTLLYADNSLVTRVEARHTRLKIALTIEDAIDFDQDVLLRRFSLRSTTDRVLEVRLFTHLDVALGGNPVGDTIFYHPETRSLIAYKNRHYLLLGGKVGDGQLAGWTTGRGDSWRDAEDAALQGVPIAFGSVDCVAQLNLGTVAPDQPTVAHSWIAAGATLTEVADLHSLVLARGPDRLIARTQHYWEAWVEKDAAQHPGLRDLPEDIRRMYHRSLLLARAHQDHEGAIIASSDSDITAAYSSHGRSGPPIFDVFSGHDNYAYSWPRDSSFVAMALDNAGYASDARAYLAFCARTMVPRHVEGDEQAFMLQKYLSNGAVASNVIAWIDQDGRARLPIQEDGSALVLIAMRNHYKRTRDWGFASPLYRRMITGIANFLADYRDPATGLPESSQDLWEERQGVHAFTIGTVWRALRDAAEFADLFAEPDLSYRYRNAANEVKLGTEKHLLDPETGRFVRSVWFKDGEMHRDNTADASVFALCYFGMFDADDPRMVATMAHVESALKLPGEGGGLARFEGDLYQLRQSAADLKVPGNPWPLCSLWLAQYHLQKAKTPADLDQPLAILQHVLHGAHPSGALAEQLDPASGEPAGATPLTWTHGTLILTVLEYLETRARIERLTDG